MLWFYCFLGFFVKCCGVNNKEAYLDWIKNEKVRFFVKCCGVNNKEAYLDWIKNEKVLNPVLTF